MTRRKRQLSLSVFVQLYGTHGNAWRQPGVAAGGRPSLAEWTRIVQQLERGKFDFAFFADFVGNGGDAAGTGRQPRGGGFEPLTLVAALSQLTEKIGLVATVNTNFNDPYNLARRFASLDHLSGGRVGWNIVSSLAENAAKSIGLTDQRDHDGRYERATEFVDVANQLWDSWDDDAFDHADKQSGIFYDPASAHPVHHHGKHFQVDALLDIQRPIQGRPVFFQAGNSETGREFAARHAEVIYAAAQTIEAGQAFYADVKSRLAKYGREHDDLKVTPGLFFHIGESRAEAQEKYQSFCEAVDLGSRLQIMGVNVAGLPLDGPLPDNLPVPENGRGRFEQMVALARAENLTIRDLIVRFAAVQGHRIMIGTAKDVADEIEAWFVGEAADGFNLKPSFHPGSLDDFIGGVIPELQRRGIFRTDYEGTTLRDHLGLRRPAERAGETAAPLAIAV